MAAVILALILLIMNTAFSHYETDLPLLLISFDGFRWDYLTKTQTPNFDKFLKQGVTARKGTKSVFVTNTLPNHWSLVTGLYSESHGVLDNMIKDPLIEKPFIPKYKDENYQNDPRYYDDGAEPIWATNQLQKKGRTGSIMWWGSENPVKWSRPTLQMPYSNNVTFEERVDTIIKWFTLENPINLGLVYFSEPDHTAHKFGPESDEVIAEIKRADSTVGYLLDQLEKKDLLDDINIIITSDHGFTEISKDRIINLDEILPMEDYFLLTYTPVASIFPNEGKFESIFSKLKQHAELPESHFKVYKASEIPEEFHYRHHKRRVPPIIAIADLGYSFLYNMSIDKFKSAGNHGFSNEYQQMRAFFLAMGPSFKQGFSVDTFNNVDVYPLMCHLLHIKPAPNNGSMEVVSLLLRDGEENTVWTFGTYILVLITIASVASVFSVAACRQHRYLKRKIIQLKLSPAQATIKYSHKGKGVNASLLSADDDEEEENFDDASDGDNILEIVSKK